MMLRAVVVAAGVLAAGVASANVPSRLVNVQVKLTRTITENGVESRKDSCPSTLTTSFQSKETINLSTPSYPMSDDSNRVNLQWKMGRLPADAKPFEGSGELVVHSEKHSKSCNGKGDDVGDGKIPLDLDKTRFSFDYKRKDTTGTIVLDGGWGDATASGSITSESRGNPTTHVDTSELNKHQTEMIATSMGNVTINTAAMWAKMGPYAAQTQKGMAAMAMDEAATIAPNGGGFEVNYTVTRTFDLAKLNPASPPTTRTGTRTITTELHISIGGPPLEYDAIIEPIKTGLSTAVGDYDTWIPIGPHPSAADGKANGLAFRVYLVRKDKPTVEVHGVPFGVRWQLDTSHEPGWTMNFPVDAGADNDLEWDAMMNELSAKASLTDTSAVSKPDRGDNMIAVVRSRDFGAYGILRAHVTLVAGGEIDGHLKGDSSPEVTIPKDKNHNDVADEWEKQVGLNHETGWDKEHFAGNNNDGDGLSFYEEYRGAWIHGEHVRLDSKKLKDKKDVFIIRNTKLPIDGGAAYFERAAENTVKVWIIDPSEIDMASKEINKNSKTGKGGPQHAINVVDVDSIDGDPLVVAQCEPKTPPAKAAGLTARQAALDNAATSPGDVIEIEVTSNTTGKLFDYAFAHELGHGLGIHHHGDRAPDKIAYYGANPIIVDAHGNLVKKPKTKPDELVGAAHSAASGDTSCIMTYNGLFDYANVGTLREHRDLYTQLQHAKDPRADNIDAQILQQTPMIPDGKKLCHGPTGRGDRNVAKPYDAFGPARLGDCFGQLRVKDY